MNRRSFLASTMGAAGLGAAGISLGAEKADSAPRPAPSKKRIKLGIATYSYWHFRDPKVSIETVIDKAAEIGVEGVDILHRQMDLPEKEPLTAEHRSYLRKLKRHAFRNGRAYAQMHRDRLRFGGALSSHQLRPLENHQ
jgi:hypothetical protein